MRHSGREKRLKWYPGVLLLSLVATACGGISAESRTYGVVPRDMDHVAVTFTYEAGRVEQSTGAEGNSTRVVRVGEERRFLALRDDIAFKLRDAGVSIVPEAQARYLVQLVPTIRETDCARTCNVIETLSLVVVRREVRDQPVARVRLENAKAGRATTSDSEFAKKAATELLTVLRGAR